MINDDSQRAPAIHNPDRKPQTAKQTNLVRQQTGWQDGWEHNKSSILRGAHPQFDRECKQPKPASPGPFAVEDSTPSV